MNGNKNVAFKQQDSVTLILGNPPMPITEELYEGDTYYGSGVVISVVVCKKKAVAVSTLYDSVILTTGQPSVLRGSLVGIGG